MNNQKRKKIFITGGHITPAIAVIEELKKAHSDWEIILIGRNTLEERLASEKNIRFLPSFAGRLSSIFKVPVGLIQSLWYCVRYKPAIVVSFGGYVALPVALAAYVFRIPVITHEQTRLVGLANKIIGMVARKICVTFEDQVDSFPKGKTVVTGLPMRHELFDPPNIAPFIVDSTLPIVYITGGSTGAVTLNDIMFLSVSRLTETYTVFHQTGTLSFTKAMQIRGTLPDSQKNRYIVQDFFETKEVSWILHQTALIIGRSGANTVLEAATLGKTMICIPLPWSAGGEQAANARWLEKRGLAHVLPQKEADSDKIVELIDNNVRKINTQEPRDRGVGLPRDGAQRLLMEVNAILGE